jgi:putative chitobiose transport system substrate-binding protein
MIRLQKFKQLVCWALLGLFTSWLVSCGIGNVGNNPKPAKTGVVTTEFWTMQLQPQFTNYFQSLITTFESQNPSIKVKFHNIWFDKK